MNDNTTTTTKPKRRANGEGTFWQEGNGWRGRISLTDLRTGKPTIKLVRGRTRAEAVDKIHEFKESVKQGKQIGNKRTVEQHLLEWLEVHVKPNKAYSTYRGYEQHIRARLIPALGHFRLDHLSGIDVQRCLNDAQKDGLSPTTVRGINATLKSALSTAKKWGCIDRNAAKDATPPKQITFKPKPLTAAQGIRLLNVVTEHRYEGCFYLGLLEGMRRGEIAGLQWLDIDFDLALIRVRGALQRVKGQGAVLIGVKSEDSEREIPLLPVVAAALRRRKERQEQERREAGKNWKQDEQFVFTSRDGHRIMPEDLHRDLQPALELAGLPRVRFHDLRHSAAHTLKALGADLKLIQMILGHSSIQITADLYLKGGISPEVRAATQKLNDAFEGSLIAAGNSTGFPRTISGTISTPKAETIQ
jgi:integrase